MKYLAGLCATFLIAGSSIAQEVPENFMERLKAFLGPQYPIDSVAESPMPGVYEVAAGGQVVYASVKDDFLLIGTMYDTVTRTNIGEQKQNKVMQDKAESAVSSVPVDDLIIFSAVGEAKRHVTIFTDMDCGYCRKLHREVPTLNAAGIEVRYMMFPMLTDQSRPKAISVWCAEDKQTALTQAKLGMDVPPRDCSNPVDQQFQVGQTIGVRGTPFIVLDDYSIIGGYVPADQLISRLGLK